MMTFLQEVQQQVRRRPLCRRRRRQATRLSK